MTGKLDAEGRWNGRVVIDYSDPDGGYTEECYMAGGRRYGISTRTYPDGAKFEDYYVSNTKVSTSKSKATANSLTTSFQVLVEKYPWFLFAYEACHFTPEWVEGFMNALDDEIDSYTFDPGDFDNSYEAALDALGDTPYDSINTLNSNLFLSNGLEELKQSEYRLAVQQHIRSGGPSTFEIISDTYPGYITMMNDSGVVTQDFKKFCDDVDDSLALYEALDPEDPFYTDSLDARMYTVVSAMITLKKSVPAAPYPLSLPAPGYTLRNWRNLIAKATSGDVAGIVVACMTSNLLEGDVLRKATREAYMNRNGISILPAVLTELAENLTNTSVSVTGYVTADGGTAVTERGIAWSVKYNPMTSDQTIKSGTGTGEFSVTINGLSTGDTYYARTFATNAKGTSYGNCIRFIASGPVNLPQRPALSDLMVYPNPASGHAAVKFNQSRNEPVDLTVNDLRGGMVMHLKWNHLPLGENRLMIDLSGLPSGNYVLHVKTGHFTADRKLVVR